MEQIKLTKVTIEYDFYKSDNIYWEWFKDVPILHNKTVDLQTVQQVFIAFITNKCDYIVISRNLNNIMIDYDKLNNEEESVVQEKITILKNYIQTYRSIIKGATKFDMKIQERQCIIELGKTRKELADTKKNLTEQIELLKEEIKELKDGK